MVDVISSAEVIDTTLPARWQRSVLILASVEVSVGSSSTRRSETTRVVRRSVGGRSNGGRSGDVGRGIGGGGS